MRSEFEKHYLSLAFHTEGSAQLCLDACTFDEKQDAYLPNMDWILENDEDECVVYCCMLNTAYISFKHQQSKIDELRKRVDDLTELNRLKTIALQQSVNRTSPYVHEKIVALEQALKGGKS